MAYWDDEDYKPINWKKKRLKVLPLDEYPDDKYLRLGNRRVSDQVFFANNKLSTTRVLDK